MNFINKIFVKMYFLSCYISTYRIAFIIFLAYKSWTTHGLFTDKVCQPLLSGIVKVVYTTLLLLWLNTADKFIWSSIFGHITSLESILCRIVVNRNWLIVVLYKDNRLIYFIRIFEILMSCLAAEIQCASRTQHMQG